MRILIIGGGGREHALAWKAAQSLAVAEVVVAPGNAGTALEDKVRNLNINPSDTIKLVAFAKANEVNLTIVGPEAPLAAGIVDAFQAAGLHCFGPNKNAAKLESSKSFSKDFMRRYHIPSANYASFTNLDAAKQYVQQRGAPLVIKADGLAAGKGVVIAHDLATALSAIDAMLGEHQYGEASRKIVVEDYIEGEEASFIAICDGEHALPLATSQDHKTRDNGGHGPNTGGMGAYSPAPIITPELHARIMAKIIQPTIAGMQQEGTPYTGFLYAGLMITASGEPMLLEYNCRLGDPETQVIMMRMNTDLMALVQAAITHQLNTTKVTWDPRTALGVVMAAGGYPYNYVQGNVIQGLETTLCDDSKVFHAGTKQQGDNIVTHGGRVLCVSALGDNVSQAHSRAYHALEHITWEDTFYRTDIGYKAMGNSE